MERDSMVFYRSFYEAIMDLPDADLAQAFRAIASYGLDGVEIECSGAAKVALKMAIPIIDKNNVRYKNGKNGGRPLEPNSNQTITKPNQEKPNHNQTITNIEPNVDVNVNVNVEKKDAIASKEKARFVKPTLENVSGYCREKELKVDAQHFIDYYESIGWVVGKTQKPMKDWKAAVRNWARQEKPVEKKNAFTTRFHNHEQQKYDFDNLNDRLFVNEKG